MKRQVLMRDYFGAMAAEANVTGGMSPTILVVDDNKELVALLTSLFEEAGYVVLGASKGKPAVELAKTEQNPDLRREAVRNLGLMDSKATGDALVEIYNSTKDVTLKKAVIQGLFTSNNPAALVALARKEEDAAMKREIVQRLSHMDSKIAIDYMLEIINK